MNYRDIKKGTRLYDDNHGPCVATAKPKSIAGGKAFVVPVKGEIHGVMYKWKVRLDCVEFE